MVPNIAGKDTPPASKQGGQKCLVAESEIMRNAQIAVIAFLS
jgi:hypothetical protein